MTADRVKIVRIKWPISPTWCSVVCQKSFYLGVQFGYYMFDSRTSSIYITSHIIFTSHITLLHYVVLCRREREHRQSVTNTHVVTFVKATNSDFWPFLSKWKGIIIALQHGINSYAIVLFFIHWKKVAEQFIARLGLSKMQIVWYSGLKVTHLDLLAASSIPVLW